MPVDTLFTLGTSPPTFNLFYSLSQFPIGGGRYMQSFEQLKYGRWSGNDKPLRPCLRESSDWKPQEDITTEDSITEEADDTPTSPKMTTSPVLCLEKCQNVQVKKRVSFADSKGLQLQTVRIMDGPSDSPPLLLHHNLMSEVIQDERAEPNHPYTYVPDFDQPASDYLDFKDRLERQNVCLESLMIKDNITILGTVKVRNIAFDKSVKIRATFDEWKTFRDFPCSFVEPELPDEEKGACAPSRYDTFSFEFDLPPNLAGKATYFCLSYKSNDVTYWDNNKNINYRIVSLQDKEASDREDISAGYLTRSQYSWDDLSFSRLEDNERPYW